MSRGREHQDWDFYQIHKIEKMFHGVFVSPIEEWNHITQENDQSSDAGVDEGKAKSQNAKQERRCKQTQHRNRERTILL